VERSVEGEDIGFSFEIRVVSGEEGRYLRLEQAQAIRALLFWMREQRSSELAIRNRTAAA
jgi:hypothetical protein